MVHIHIPTSVLPFKFSPHFDLSLREAWKPSPSLFVAQQNEHLAVQNLAVDRTNLHEL
jgi:hypothetical protein